MCTWMHRHASCLHVHPAVDDSGNILNPIQSARIRTSTSLNIKYGRIEVRARMPRGDWLWPVSVRWDVMR